VGDEGRDHLPGRSEGALRTACSLSRLLALLASTTTDEDGVYSFPYKHTGKQATYAVKLPAYRLQRSATLKANGYALVLFESLPEGEGLNAPTSTWQKGTPISSTNP
jgi:hypothetical protein